MKNIGIGTSGVSVEDQGEAGLGRVLLATQDYAIGDIILEESPLVVFSNSWLGLLQQYYTTMTNDDKVKLMDMQHLSSKEDAHFAEFIVPLTDRLDQLLEQPPIQQFLQIFPISSKDVFQLSTLVSINSHMYSEENEDKMQSALFYLASKACHSCHPNACYSSKLQPKKLVYYAIKPIVCGEMITISYLPPSPLNTKQRRDFLKQAKDFYCQCHKCNSADYLSAMKCVDYPDCRGITIPTYVDTGVGHVRSCWCCEACSMITSPDLSTAATYQQRLEYIIETAEIRGGSTAEDCQALEKLIEELNEPQCKLASSHHIVLEAMMKLFQYYSELAMLADQFDPTLALRLHKDAIRIGFPFIRRWECAEDICHLGETCSLTHRIVIDAVPIVLAVCLDAIKCKHPLPDWIDQYIPYLQRCYGVLDSDISLVRKYRKQT